MTLSAVRSLDVEASLGAATGMSDRPSGAASGIIMDKIVLHRPSEPMATYTMWWFLLAVAKRQDLSCLGQNFLFIVVELPSSPILWRSGCSFGLLQNPIGTLDHLDPDITGMADDPITDRLVISDRLVACKIPDAQGSFDSRSSKR